MRNIKTLLSLISVAILFTGCSIMHVYVLRNYSRSSVTFTIKTAAKTKSIFSENSIKLADKIVPIKRRDIAESFDENVSLSKISEGVYQVVIPAGYSANISAIVGAVAGYYSVSDSFNNTIVEIKSGNTVLSFGNNLREMEQFFRSKAFLAFGPVVHYLDLK